MEPVQFGQQEKIAGDYDEVSAMGNGVAAVKSDNKWSLIDTNGKKVTKDKYDSVVMDSKGIVCRNDRVFAKQNGYYYLFDSKGNKVVKTKFDDARLFADDGYAAVCVDGKWGFVDKDGKQMIKPQFNEAHSFSNGLAAVRFTNGWGYVDERVIKSLRQDLMMRAISMNRARHLLRWMINGRF